MANQKIQLPVNLKKSVLAFGAQAKNTLCFARGDSAILSSLHADLNNAQDFFAFEKDALRFLKKRPQIIASDLHPEYQSTKYIHNLQPTTYNLQPVQHHHAHIASCMAENGLKNQKVIGVAFDGTGFGTDNTLWGAEFLLCDYKNFTRAAHLKEIPLLGGERAIIEPWRVAAAWLYFLYKDRFLNLGLKFTKGINKKKWGALKAMYARGFNSPLASSMGRLFDAAAALTLIKYKVKSEAELPIRLEKIGARFGAQGSGGKNKGRSYGFKIVKIRDKYVINPLPMFTEMMGDLKAGKSKERIAYRFHLTVAEMTRRTCLILRKDTGINKIALSGGVFQNTLLLGMVLDLLYREGFQVFRHKKLSGNDSCVSLGQAVIAGF